MLCYAWWRGNCQYSTKKKKSSALEGESVRPTQKGKISKIVWVKKLPSATFELMPCHRTILCPNVSHVPAVNNTGVLHPPHVSGRELRELLGDSLSWDAHQPLHRLLRAHNSLLATLGALLCGGAWPCTQPLRGSCTRDSGGHRLHKDALDYDVVPLNGFPSSGNSYGSVAWQRVTGIVPASLYAEKNFLRSWGRAGPDGTLYVWNDPKTKMTLDALRARNASTGRIRAAGEPMLIKTHQVDFGCNQDPVCNSADPAACCHVTKVVHLIRNPLDNVFSQYKDGKGFTLRNTGLGAGASRGFTNASLARWVRYGEKAVRAYVHWHIRSLVAYRRRPVLLVSFEDMISRSPIETFGRVLGFAGAEPSSDWPDALQTRLPGIQSGGKCDRDALYKCSASIGPHPAAQRLTAVPRYLLSEHTQWFSAEPFGKLVDAYEAAVANASRLAAQAIRDADEGSWVEERSTTMWYWHCGRPRPASTTTAATGEN